MSDDAEHIERLRRELARQEAAEQAAHATPTKRKAGLAGIGALLLAILSKAKGLLVGLKFLSLGKVLTTGGTMLLSIAGPIAGGLAALAYTGFFLNLFNCLPVSPLDGGRVAAVLHQAAAPVA